MATTQRKRALTQTTLKSKPVASTRRLASAQSKTTTTDQLADALATRLTISDEASNKKGKKKAPDSHAQEMSDEEKRVESMRAVNAASQSFSSIIQSGWKKGSEVANGKKKAKSGTMSNAMDAVGSASAHLAILRSLSPNDFNVERAAGSVLGKLISLEMYDAASLALKDMHPQLCSHLNSSFASDQQRGFTSYISLPLPSSPASKDDSTLLTVVSTYLTYSLIIATQGLPVLEKSKNNGFIHVLADALDATNISPGNNDDTSHTLTLLSWLPLLGSLPPKHIDNLLSRTYTCLTKFCATSLAEPTQRPISKKPASLNIALHRDSYRIRMYALHCLAYTTEEVVPPATIWDQAVRYGTAYVRSITSHSLSQSNSGSENEATRIILSSCSLLVDHIGSFSDRQKFTEEKAFIPFLEWWMAFARRVGDLQSLNRIASLMRSALDSSTPSNNPDRIDGGSHTTQATDPTSKKTDPQATETLVMRGMHICTVFAQITALVDQDDKERDVLSYPMSEALSILSSSNSLLELLAVGCRRPTDSPVDASFETLQRAGNKCDRALEKLRKSAGRALETAQATDHAQQEIRSTITKLLEGFVGFFERASQSHPSASVYTRALDTLFSLARITMAVNDPRTHDPTYRYLHRAAKLLEIGQENPNGIGVKELANYVRCVSGTFYNIAGTLYQATRCGMTIPFLVDSCNLGQKALSMYLSNPGKATGRNGEDADANKKEAEVWRQLEEQLHRRWELLGVCYAKIGDRKSAYAAFVECIKAFPYRSSGFTEKARRLHPASLFEATTTLKQLAAIVDRVTYMAACELFLDPEKISLSHPSIWVGAKRPDDDIIGLLVERQISSLDSSRWKSNLNLILAQLLLDASRIYGAELMPVRRARVLTRWMEFAYHANLAEEQHKNQANHLGTITEVMEEVERLVSDEHLGVDTELAIFCAQYRASAHLWCALRAHHKGDVDQNTSVAEHTEQASAVLKKLLSDVSESRKASAKISQSPPKKTLSKKGGSSARKIATGSSGSRARVVKKVTVKEPVTPRPKGRAALQAISPNDSSPRTISLHRAEGLAIDDFDKFLKVLQTTAHILGLMALVLPKVHILDVTRKLCEIYAGVANDGYISASIDLAYEYVKLGKLRRASAVFNHALNSVRSGQVSDDVCAMFLLRYAEALAVLEDVHQSSSVYREALTSSQRCAIEEKNVPTLEKVRLRVKRLERVAMAAHVFALIQYSRNDVVTSLTAMLQSLRLWNRAVDTLSRLNPNKDPESDKDVFEAVPLKGGLPTAVPDKATPPKRKSVRPSLDNLEWRVSEGLLSILFSLCQTYLLRGSAKEAEYFAQQAQDLSQSLNAPAPLSRALAKKGEILLQLGKLEEAHECLAEASEILANIPGIDSADIYRLRGDHSQRTANHKDAQQMYVETTTMIDQLDSAFKHFDGLALGPRKSAGLTPTDKPSKETIVPDLLASVLRQQIWLLRDEGGDEYMTLLEKLMALPYSSRTKAEENALMAQLTLHNVYSRFRNDMFLSSLSESAIALPMGMTSRTDYAISPTSQDLLSILDNAAKLFWANLSLIATNGSVPDTRNATTSLALISAFQTSLGRPGKVESILSARLLDISSSITLTRELIEAIPHKFLDVKSLDDLEWPLVSPEGKPLPLPARKPTRPMFDASEDEDDEAMSEKNLKDYWNCIQEKYQSQQPDAKSLSSSLVQTLPTHWTAVHLNVTNDKGTLFASRQRGGILDSSPLIFCVPLKGRRDNGAGDEDENHLTYEDALAELRDIVKLSDEGTRVASRINPDDEMARAQWWKERRDLDLRLRELLDNIEFCWLGAFKTILNPAPSYPAELLTELRVKLEKLFQQCLGVRDKQNKVRNQKKSAPGPTSTVAPSELILDDALVECFSTLPPKCRDEELEDLIYFVLDLYQFHGIRVAIAEIDMIQLAIDLRSALEEHAARVRKFHQQNSGKMLGSIPADKDEHIFLVLGKDVQGIPWESIPILRGRSVSRIPSLDFLLDRVDFVNRQNAAFPLPRSGGFTPFGANVDPCKGYYVLNPSGDLSRTQGRFKGWVKDMEKVGWSGTIGRPPSEQEFLGALQRQDLVVYFGHGGGEQYLRTHKIRSLARCAATMLWGCSSGALREMGDFDRSGTPNSYFVAGCPTLVANLWDVTDKDIDKFSQAVFEQLHLSADGVRKTALEDERRKISVVTAVAKSREVCKLKYLTGAAPVVYGIPFYL